MKVLVLGAGGMIGHKMFHFLTQAGLETFATLHKSRDHYKKFSLFTNNNSTENLDILNSKQLFEVLEKLKPNVILNCIGITLRKPEIKDFSYSEKINSKFPHQLNEWCAKNSAYLIQFSTDCVFSGKEGPYSELSPKTATDTYGVTKAAGEVSGPNALTLRGSMIGRELEGKTELLEWALSQKNQSVRGFSKAIYSGVTTNVMAELVLQLLKQPERLTGLYQVSSKPISKLDLLRQLNDAYKLNMTITEDATFSTSKVLLSDKLSEKLGFYCPPWPDMIKNLTKDSFVYLD
jgi:dTDP-4-dehydrorhamnose reductase